MEEKRDELMEALSAPTETMEDRVESQKSMRLLLTSFIKSQLVEGTDYGTIRIGGRDSKPTLFKPGSEKFLSLFSLQTRFSKDEETMTMLPQQAIADGTICYRCDLLNRDGVKISEGRGACSVKSKQGEVNTAIKIAEKRAQIDAILRHGALSDFFTQDLDDMVAPVAAPVAQPVAQPEPSAELESAPKATARSFGDLAMDITTAADMATLRVVWGSIERGMFTEEQMRRLAAMKDARKAELEAPSV